MKDTPQSAEAVIALTNALGLHARAVMKIQDVTKRFPGCTIWASHGGNRMDLKSTSELMFLEVPCGGRLQISASGYEALDAVGALKELIVKERFREPAVVVSFLTPACITTSLRGRVREAVILELLGLLAREHSIGGGCLARLASYAAERELKQAGMSAIGGVAYSHADDPECPRLAAAMGLFPEPMDWQAADGRPVRIVYLVVGPDDQSYKWALVDISDVLRSESVRAEILNLSDPQAIHRVLSKEADRLTESLGK